MVVISKLSNMDAKIDKVTLSNGNFEKVFIDQNADKKEYDWSVTTVLNVNFEGGLEGGNVSNEGYKITHIKLARCLNGTNDWEVINVFDYNENQSLYAFEDRYVQNQSEYIYAVIPVANDIDGDMMKSDVLVTNFDGVYLTDNETNIKLTYDLLLGEVTYNSPQALSEPINSPYPIVKTSKLNYRSGKLTVTPVTERNIKSGGGEFSVIEEQVLRSKWISFLNNRKAKVLRMDNGVSMLVSTSNVVEAHKETVTGMATISFDYVEIGGINFDNMLNNGLIADTLKDKSFVNQWGESKDVF